MNAAVEDFDLDDVEIKPQNMEKFQVEKDKTYRVGFPLVKENGRILIKKVDYFTLTTGSEANDDEQYFSFRKSEDPKVNEAAEAAGAELSTRYVTLLIKYATDKNGKPLLPLQWELIPVKLDGKKVAALKALNEEWDLTTIDIKITSDNPTYQYHTYLPLQKSIWAAAKGDKLLDQLNLDGPITADVQKAVASFGEDVGDIADAIAKGWKDSAIMSKLGGVAEEADTAALDDEFADLGDDDLG